MKQMDKKVALETVRKIAADYEDKGTGFDKYYLNGSWDDMPIIKDLLKAYEAGYDKGYEVGYDRGWDSGNEVGYTCGYQDGKSLYE